MTTINEQAILDLFDEMPISEVFEILENFNDDEAGPDLLPLNAPDFGQSSFPTGDGHA